MNYRRAFLAVLAIAVLSTAPAMAAQPSSGTVAPPNVSAQWIGGPYTVGVPNQLGCLTPQNPTCDAFSLSVNLPTNYRFVVAIASEIEGDDYDLYVYYPDGTEAGRSANAGGNESVVIVHNTSHGTGPYQVRVLPFEVTSGSTYQGIARSTSQQPIEPEDPNACLEAVPAALGLAGITDLGQTVSLDVAVLLDGVSVNDAVQLMNRAAISYAPLKIDLNVVSYTPVTFTGTEGDALIQQAKNHFGGRRPAGADLVYVLSNKDLTTDGDTSLAGLADCIGGVAFPDRAFAVGENFSSDEAGLLGLVGANRNLTAKVAAHEIGHLMGGHHHYANCAEGILTETDELSPCTLMFNDVGLASLNFSAVNKLVVQGHGQLYAAP